MRARAAVAIRPLGPKTSATVRAARRLNRAAGTLAAVRPGRQRVEHYRGSFKNKAMFTPLIVSALTLATSIHGTADMRPVAHRMRDMTYLLAAATGLIGTGFHIYNVGKKVGGFSWQNLFYARAARRADGHPAVGPCRLLLGAGARERTGNAARDLRPAGGPNHGGGAGRRPARHDRRSRAAAFSRRLSQSLHDASGDAAAARRRCSRRPRPAGPAASTASRAGGCGFLAAMGFAGVGFHAYGVSRNMGGWRNWSQNVLNGPPLPAPPSFAGLALAGLAALGLMKDHPDA